MPIDEITQKVSDRYARAASTGEQLCCPTGYNFDELRSFIPDEVLKISYGCGTPAGLDTVHNGETVLDIGSGGGIDCFEASRRVGQAGHVIGIDMTDTMLEIARRNAPIVAKNLGFAASNVEFRKGMADAMPVDDATIDLIISNCVINLAPDKRRVFREMSRVIRPGGRFTISDIVSDHIVPQYLVHDTEKWGNCLSGALPVSEYVGGLIESGFVGVHQLKYYVWQVIDGIHFLSLTLTGYKQPVSQNIEAARFATLRGPFSRIIDEAGIEYHRGIPLPIGPIQAACLRTPALAPHFLLTSEPRLIDACDPEHVAVLPEDKPCVWQGHYAILIGPFREAADDDHHVYRRGEPLEICSKTRLVLESPGYAGHFSIYSRASGDVSGSTVACSPSGGCC